MQKAAQAYMQTQVTTVNQGDLLIMLFDGCIKFLRQAKERMAERDYAKKGILISKALDIIAELQGSLNAQKGGELAQNLKRIYMVCSTRLLMANMKMDPKMIDGVIDTLSGIRDAFAQINTPEFVPKQAAPQATGRQAGPLASVMVGDAPSAGTSLHRAVAAYANAHARKDAG